MTFFFLVVEVTTFAFNPFKVKMFDVYKRVVRTWLRKQCALIRKSILLQLHLVPAYCNSYKGHIDTFWTKLVIFKVNLSAHVQLPLGF